MAIKPDITEKELVQACLEGKARAQEQLYNKYSPVIYAICMRYAGNSENANDMLQESFIKIFGRLRDFRFEGSFEGWMKRLAVNHCLDFYKKLKTEPFLEELDGHSQLATGDSVVHHLQAADLIGLLQKLPTGYRTVFNLYAIEGYGHQEIAEMLSISENTSKTQLFKARKLLQDWVNRK
ncbi:MAG: sigma-70 family RNA polymerase sigma factor [Bacteroidetes bacterium]|nr:sigma-70 family RNA polymerase sigma factor [Bacteroidota bacterium]